MDKVLIVDNDQDTLKKIREGFKELHHFELLTTTTIKGAVDELGRTRVSVVATNVRLPESDGLELLAFMTRKFPSIPCIAMLERGDAKPFFTDRTGHTGVLYYLQKPFSFGRLASAIFVGLNLRDEGQTRNGLVLKNFLPLVAVAQKTCRMEVRLSVKKKGFMYFENGKLLGAQANGEEGDAAAKQMADWQGIQLFFSSLPPENKAQRIETDLMTVARATWEKPARPAPPPKETPPEKTKPKQPSAEPKPRSKLENALLKHANVIRTAKGYRGLAIVSSEGKVLASDTREAEGVDFGALAQAVNNVFTDASKQMGQKGLGRCQGLTLHTDQGILIMRPSDLYSGGNYRFLALMTEDGNGFFMQVQLKTIIPKIISDIS